MKDYKLKKIVLDKHLIKYANQIKSCVFNNSNKLLEIL